MFRLFLSVTDTHISSFYRNVRYFLFVLTEKKMCIGKCNLPIPVGKQNNWQTNSEHTAWTISRNISAGRALDWRSIGSRNTPATDQYKNIFVFKNSCWWIFRDPIVENVTRTSLLSLLSNVTFIRNFSGCTVLLKIGLPAGIGRKMI